MKGLPIYQTLYKEGSVKGVYFARGVSTGRVCYQRALRNHQSQCIIYFFSVQDAGHHTLIDHLTVAGIVAWHSPRAANWRATLTFERRNQERWVTILNTGDTESLNVCSNSTKSLRTIKLKKKNHMPHIMCHLSRVTYKLSPITYRMSHVTYHNCFKVFFSSYYGHCYL